MTSCKVTGLVLRIYGRNVLTLFSSVGTSRMEETALGRISRGGNITLQDDSIHLNVGVRLRDSREERLSVGVQRIVEDILLVTELDHRAKVHNADLIRDKLNYGEVVRDEEVGEVHRLLQALQKVDDLRLDRYVKSGYRLVTNNELRLY